MLHFSRIRFQSKFTCLLALFSLRMKSLDFQPVFPGLHQGHGEGIICSEKGSTKTCSKGTSTPRPGAAAVPSSRGVPPANNALASLLRRCPSLDHRGEEPGKKPPTICGILALQLPGCEAGLEQACAQSVPYFSHLENGDSINNDFMRLPGGLHNTPSKVLSTMPDTGCTPINGPLAVSPLLWLTGRVACVTN